MSEHDDSAEVERLGRTYNLAYSGGWTHCDATEDTCHLAGVRAVLADLRERYVLVPREGAEMHWAEGRVGDDGVIRRVEDALSVPTHRRLIVRGPWQVAE